MNYRLRLLRVYHPTRPLQQATAPQQQEGGGDSGRYCSRVAAHNADGWSPVQNTDDGDSIDLGWGVEGLKTASAYNAAAPQASGDPF